MFLRSKLFRVAGVLLITFVIWTWADVGPYQIPLPFGRTDMPVAATNEWTVNDGSRWTIRTPDLLDKDHLSRDLIPFVLEPLPLGSIKPLGWVKNELHLMADGMPGHLHTFYRIIKDGTWMGGTQEYSRLNEAWPYWFNGIVALAYSLDDDRLKTEIDRVTDHVLEHQFEDGWLGPEQDLHKRNFWGRYPFLLGLMQLIQVSDEARAKVLLNSVHHFVKLMHSMLENDNQGYVSHPGDDYNQQWGRARAADMVIFLQWLYEHDPRDNSQIIFDSMVHFYDYSFDWTYYFRGDVFMKGDFDNYEEGDVRRKIYPYVHVVNAAQGLKYGSVMRRFTNINRFVEDTLRGTNLTFEYHGAPSGAIIGDEGESGVAAHRGSELCSVVEAMYSLTYNYQATGDKYHGERAELVAFNALPVMLTPDWWAHQYVAQSNQPVSHHLNHQPFWNVGPLGATYGTEPHYPCCTVNHGQGLPKYLSASFVKNGDNGIAHAQLMPAEVYITLSGGKEVHVRCETKYPFDHMLEYTITSESAFDFSFRIPEWTIDYEIKINNVHHTLIPSTHLSSMSGLYTIPIQSGRTAVQVTFSAQPIIEPRINDTISIHYGSLLYALPVPSTWHGTRPARYPGSSAPSQAQDWTITPLELSKWNLAIDPSTITIISATLPHDQPLPNPIWTHEHTEDEFPFTRLRVKACELEGWELTEKRGGYAPPPPEVGERRCKGEGFEVELWPYGACKVHMAEFPRVDLENL